MDRKILSDKILFFVYDFIKNMIFVYGICISLAVVIALVFYVVKGTPFTQTYLDALGAFGIALMFIGALILAASAHGEGGPVEYGGYVNIRYTEEVGTWKRGFASRVGQGLFLFVCGLLLEFIVYVTGPGS